MGLLRERGNGALWYSALVLVVLLYVFVLHQ